MNDMGAAGASKAISTRSPFLCLYLCLCLPLSFYQSTWDTKTGALSCRPLPRFQTTPTSGGEMHPAWQPQIVRIYVENSLSRSLSLSHLRRVSWLRCSVSACWACQSPPRALPMVNRHCICIQGPKSSASSIFLLEGHPHFSP